MAKGRKTKYSRAFNKQAEKLCLLGAIDKDLADFFEVNVSTINNWKKEFPSFKKSLDKGKRVANANVAGRLYDSAMGVKIKSTKFFQYQGKILKQDVVEEFPPNQRSIEYFLNNREPELWKALKAANSSNDDRLAALEIQLKELEVAKKKAELEKLQKPDDSSNMADVLRELIGKLPD
jgi:hypothetical protein